ncbi:MAG: hypothetical protein Q8N00_17365 [Nitrospirota bacterium]|nr:hypothetical protein [Nitrospirota bacterium]
MTLQSRPLSIIGAGSLLVALLAWSHPVTFAAETDSRMPSGETGDIGSRGMPQLQRPMLPGNPGQSGTPGQPNAQLPTYPQKFDVKGPEVDSFGFAVTQPGPVVVEVQSQGAPVSVTLQGPAPQPISQQGAGPLRLTYTVTPQDIQKSLLWRLQIRLVQPTPPQQGGLANGMVNIQYPPVNQAAVEQAIQSRTKQRKEPTEQEQQQAVAQTGAKMEAAFQQHKAQFDRQQMDRRASMMSQIQPQFDQLQGRMGGQVRSRSIEGVEGTPAEPVLSTEGEIGTRALQLQMPQKMLKVSPLLPPVASNPVIASVNVTQGQPGDPVMINGSGFGTGGEVHFIIAPGMDLVAPAAAIWSDGQIFTSVPDASGVLAFNGTVYVKSAASSVNSNIVPFRFNPAMELRQIKRMTESQLQQFNGVNVFNWQGSFVRRSHQFMFWGPKGNDHIFMNARLKNGWVVSQTPLVYLSFPAFTDGGVYLVESHVGTDRPHMNVGFWVDDWFSNMFTGGSSPTLDYAISMLIQGPKGVADGLVVP